MRSGKQKTIITQGRARATIGGEAGDMDEPMMRGMKKAVRPMLSMIWKVSTLHRPEPIGLRSWHPKENQSHHNL